MPGYCMLYPRFLHVVSVSSHVFALGPSVANTCGPHLNNTFKYLGGSMSFTSAGAILALKIEKFFDLKL